MDRNKLRLLAEGILFSLLISGYSCASKKTHDNQSIIPGSVSKVISCAEDTIQKYVLYLPSSYTPDRKWPLIICFDPHAEGLLPLNLFKDEAEKNGYIVAGSNNSKNGLPIEETTGIYRKLLGDLKSRFSIDDQAIYLAGFSGGSRVAGAAAITEGNVAGVIGCGAGLPNLYKQPVKPFSYLAIAGLQDFNYNEVKQVDESLESAGYNHHMLDFDGIHQWPPKELVPSIFAWLAFDRMRTGSLAVDRNIINNFIDKESSEAEAAGQKGNLPLQQSILVMMKDYLQGLTDVSPILAEISQLDKEPGMVKHKDDLQALADQESAMQSKYSQAFQNETLAWWEKETSGLKLKSSKEPLDDECRMYKRILGFLSLNAYMFSNSALKQHDLDAATKFVEIYRTVDPGNAEHRYIAASISMMKNNNDQAVLELQDAIGLGFKEFQRLRTDPVFTLLHEDARFKKLLEGH
jgi:hypothetical protein